MSCDAESLLALATAAKFTELSEGDRRAVMLQLLCDISQGSNSIIALKTADEDRVNNAGQDPDSELTVDIEAGGMYLIRCFLVFRYDGGATGKAHWKWLYPSYNTFKETTRRTQATLASTTITSDTLYTTDDPSINHAFLDTGTNVIGYNESLMFLDASADGTFSVGWGQFVLSATAPCVLRAGSYLFVSKVQ